jgi:hypothetical protein
MPRSINSTLAPSFSPSIELLIVPTAVLPASVTQLYLKSSSDLLILCVPGILTFLETLLFDRSHDPELPSLNHRAIGTSGSFTIVAQLAKTRAVKMIKMFFINPPYY